MTTKLSPAFRAWLAALAIAALGCDPSDPCDPGDEEVHGLCSPIEMPEPGDGDGDGDGDDQDGGSEPDAEPPSDPYEGFGDTCDEPADCPDDFICGAPMLPYCTRVNCLDDESICPSGWTCYDTTGVSPDPSVTSICLDL